MDKHNLAKKETVEYGNIIVPETNGNEEFNSVQNSRKNSFVSNDSIKNFVSLFMVQKTIPTSSNVEKWSNKSGNKPEPRLLGELFAEEMYRITLSPY